MSNTTLELGVKIVAQVLNAAKQHNLEVEVMATALINLENRSCDTIYDALKDAAYEWDIAPIDTDL